MPAPLAAILVILAAYLIGAIPTGVIIGRMMGRDPMKEGSGKTGANNTFRTAGPAAGIAVLIIDLLKGYIAASLAHLLSWPDSAWLDLTIGGSGAAAIIGHNWSLWVRIFVGKWGGGRGIMTAFGAVLTVSIWIALAALVVGGIVLFASRYMVWAVVIGVAAGIAAAIILGVTGVISGLLVPGVIIWCLLVVVGFNDNIGRLLSGTEPKIGKGAGETS